jgi:hypothetical protein
MNENSTQESASQEQDVEARLDDRRFGDRGFGARPLPFQFQIPLGGGAPALALPLGGIGSPLAFTVPLGGGAAAPSAVPVAPTTAPAAPAQPSSPPADTPVAVAPETPLYVPPTDTMSEVELLAENAVAAAETLGRASAAGLSSSAFLESLFGKSQGPLEALSPMGAVGGAPTATALFHAIVGGRASPRRSAFEQRYADRFLVLGCPGERPGAISPRRGDLLIRVALGQGWGSVGVVGSHGLHRHDRLPLLGLRFEGYPRLEPGAYVHLVEPGPSYRSIEARFARRVCDQNGVVLPDTLLLRLKPSTKSAEPVEADPDAGATAQGAQVLRLGQSGSAVRRAQAQLNRIHADLTALQLPGLPGCPLHEDGRFTDCMARAVLAFQQQIFADPAQWEGSIGPATKRQLDLLAGPAVPAIEFFAEAAPPISCRADLSKFGLSRREHDQRQGRRPQPQSVAGRPLCPGRIDLVQSGPDGGTIDLLLWNFDIDGTYTKVQHEAALDRLIFELHRRLVGVGGAGPTATSYRLLLSGFASRTGTAVHNQALANEREDTLHAYLQANLEKFLSIPEAPIGPLVTFERHPGGFDPNAPPDIESPHARSARVIAVPVGTPVPPPRPIPTAEIAFVLDDDNDTIVDERAPVATFLRFGLWNHAYNTAGDVRNGQAETDNFIGSERRRFYVRIRDSAARTARVTATWKTLLADGTTDDDAPVSQAITLTETRSGSHVFVSKALMVVTDDTDAGQETHSGLHPPLINAGIRQRGQSDHRLRRARMEGSMFAEYTPASGPTVNVKLPVFRRSPTDERRRLKVRVINYGSKATAAYIAGQFDHANRRWTQIGLSIDAQSTVDRPIPAGVLGADGRYLFEDVPGPREQAVLNDLIPVTPDNTLTAVFLPLRGANAFTTIYPTAPPATTSPLGDRFFVFVDTALDLNDETLAHELAHVLFNRFDAATERRFFTLNTNAPVGFGVTLPDPRIYRRIQDRHNSDPDNDLANDNIVNWARRARGARFPVAGGLGPATATTGNKLTEAF